MVHASFCDLGFDALDGWQDVSETARTTRVANVARAPLGRDVLPNSVDDVGPSALNELMANDSFGFSEAVAEMPGAGHLLLPHRHPDVDGSKAITSVSEVHNVARGVAAEPIVCQLNSPERALC
jgi:hypothetical protein